MIEESLSTADQSQGPRCGVCGQAATPFLTRKQVPVHQNLLLADPAAARAVPRGDLAWAVCGQCGFVFNQAFDPAKLSYGRDYENTQTCSQAFGQHVDDLVHDLIHERGVRNCRIVEVGCGKGHFVRRLVEPAEFGNTGIGFDPSYTGPRQAMDGRLSFRRCYYDESSPDAAADVVICRHVIEHTGDPVDLLRMIRRSLTGSARPRIFLETPCVSWILTHRVIWDFFYEHCSLFTAESLAWALDAAGLGLQHARHVFGDQYLWAEAVTHPGPPDAQVPGPHLRKLALDYGADEQRLLRQWRRKAEAGSSRGRLAIWGAGAKGVTLANLVDPDVELVDCLIDINPAKQGHYVPGTGHPIIGWQQIPVRGIDQVILTNPNYRREISQLLSGAGLTIQLVE